MSTFKGALVGLSGVGDIAAPALQNEEQTEAWLADLYAALDKFSGDPISDRLFREIEKELTKEAENFVRGCFPDVLVKQSTEDPSLLWVSIVLIGESNADEL